MRNKTSPRCRITLLVMPGSGRAPTLITTHGIIMLYPHTTVRAPLISHTSNQGLPRYRSSLSDRRDGWRCISKCCQRHNSRTTLSGSILNLQVPERSCFCGIGIVDHVVNQWLPCSSIETASVLLILIERTAVV